MPLIDCTPEILAAQRFGSRQKQRSSLLAVWVFSILDHGVLGFGLWASLLAINCPEWPLMAN